MVFSQNVHPTPWQAQSLRIKLWISGAFVGEIKRKAALGSGFLIG